MQFLMLIKDLLVFIGKAWTEADGNGGKASFSRIAGTYIILQIVNIGYMAGRAIPPEWMTMFWVLIGYQIVAKILSALSPAVLDIARSVLVKAGASVNIPPPVQ